MARNNEPAFRRKTPLLICSIRTEIPYPCIGSSANVFRMSISSVPWTRSLGLSDIRRSPWLPGGEYSSHTGCQEKSHERIGLPIPKREDVFLRGAREMFDSVSEDFYGEMEQSSVGSSVA